MTTETKVTHTPGPWTATADMDGDHAVFAGKDLIAITDGWRGGNSTKRDLETDAANAHIIAAAPDMLQALEAIHLALNVGRNRNGRVDGDFASADLIQRLAQKYDIGGCADRVEQCAKVAAAAIAKAKGSAA